MRLVLKLLVLAAILCAAAVLMVEGAPLMRVAEAMPAYTDPGLAHSLRLTMPHELEEYRKDGRAFTRRWHEKMAALRTDKWEVYDRGRTMIVLALCVLGAVLLFRLWRDHAVANMRTPSRGTLFWLGVTTYFSIVPPFWIMLLDQQRREYLPWWADSIGLPGFGLVFMLLLTLPVLLLLLWLCTRRAELPAQLWDFDASRPVISILATLILGGAALAASAIVVEAVWHGVPYFIFWALCSIYVLLCMRAALVAPRELSTEANNDNWRNILVLR
jgi:hypothetical protein